MVRNKVKLAELQRRLEEAGVEHIIWNTVADDTFYWMLPDDDKRKIAYGIVNAWMLENMQEETKEKHDRWKRIYLPLSIDPKRGFGALLSLDELSVDLT